MHPPSYLIGPNLPLRSYRGIPVEQAAVTTWPGSVDWRGGVATGLHRDQHRPGCGARCWLPASPAGCIPPLRHWRAGRRERRVRVVGESRRAWLPILGGPDRGPRCAGRSLNRHGSGQQLSAGNCLNLSDLPHPVSDRRHRPHRAVAIIEQLIQTRVQRRFRGVYPGWFLPDVKRLARYPRAADAIAPIPVVPGSTRVGGLDIDVVVVPERWCD